MALSASIAKESRGYLLIPTKRIRRYPGQPRLYIEPLALMGLEASIRHIGQRRAITVKAVTGDPDHDYELIDGERRWLCCKRIGTAKMKAVVEEPENDDEQFISSVILNIPSQEHTPLEIAHAIERIRKSEKLKRMPRTEQMKYIGAMFGHDEIWAYRYLRLLELDHRVHVLMDGKRSEDERLNVSIAYFLLGYSPEIQVKSALRAVTMGWSLRQVEVYAAGLAAESGEIRSGVRPKRPSDNYRNLLSFLRRLHEGAELVLSMPNRSFEEMFLARDPKDREKTIGEVRACRADLAEIEQVLERLKQNA